MTGYTSVTEVPGDRITSEAWRMRQMRYAYARRFCDGKDVLEVACGAGQGLGYLARKARRVVGADYTAALLDIARRHYGGRIPLVRLDAQDLPVRDKSFDVIILHEAIYYLRDPAAFVKECRRVLRTPGVVVLGSVNCDWRDFNPSPMSIRYLNGRELTDLLSAHGFTAALHGAFPAAAQSRGQGVVSTIKRIAIALRLIPRTMKGKVFLKRLFLGQLISVPMELAEEMTAPAMPVPLPSSAGHADYKILFAVGHVG